jgi:ribosomal protein S18 acetylase RimI-like enzyme
VKAGFTVVDARPQHFEWILELAVAASTSTFNGLRSTPAECAQGIRDVYPELKKWVERGQYRFFVCIEDATDKPAGYLMLNLYDVDDLDRRQTFIQDAATLPEYFGKGVQHLLYAEAIRVTAELGIDFVGAEFSSANPYYETALRNGCILESYKVIRPCTPAAYEKLRVAQEHREALKEVKSKLDSLKERRERSRARRQKTQ